MLVWVLSRAAHARDGLFLPPSWVYNAQTWPRGVHFTSLTRGIGQRGGGVVLCAIFRRRTGGVLVSLGSGFCCFCACLPVSSEVLLKKSGSLSKAPEIIQVAGDANLTLYSTSQISVHEKAFLFFILGSDGQFQST